MMQGLTFKSGDTQEKAFSREVTKRVRTYFKEKGYSKTGNFNMYLKSVILLALYIAPFVLILTVPMHALTALGMVVLIGIGEAGVGMSVMHDGAHGSYSKKRWVNKLASCTMYLLGSNTLNWRIQHNVMHHTFTNIYQYDPDISTKAVIRLCDYAPLKKYHRYQHLYAFPLYGLMTLMRLFTDLYTLLQYNKDGITNEQKAKPKLEIFKLILTKVIYLGVIFGLPLWLTPFSFWQVFLGFLVMHFIAGMIMGTVFQMAHVVKGAEQYQPSPDDVIHQEWLVHEIQSTSDFGRKNGLLSWYIGGLDFQIEHHLFPNICHVHYPKIAPIVEKTIKEYGFSYHLHQSFLEALKSHYQRLKELGKSKPSVKMAG